MCFENATIERHIRGVFARWRFGLGEFTGSYSEMLAPYRVFGLDFNGELN